MIDRAVDRHVQALVEQINASCRVRVVRARRKGNARRCGRCARGKGNRCVPQRVFRCGECCCAVQSCSDVVRGRDRCGLAVDGRAGDRATIACKRCDAQAEHHDHCEQQGRQFAHVFHVYFLLIL